MIYLVVQNFLTQDGVVNGGSQSARNLISGLKSLDTRFTIVSQSGVQSPEQVPTVTLGKCAEAPLISLSGVPAPREWRDPAVVQAIRQLLERLPQSYGIFHLLEVNNYLGCWLCALEQTDFKVVVTALDYSWLCTRSHLLTAQAKHCPGPESATACLQCYYNHRDFHKALALKLCLGASYMPSTLLPDRLKLVKTEVEATTKITVGRLADLQQDFRQVDALVAPSQVLQHFFVKNGFPQDHIFHVPYGTQPAEKIGPTERPALSEGVVFGFVGRLTFDKGLDLLIDALVAIRAETSYRPRLIVYAGAHPSGTGKHLLKRILMLKDWVTLDQFNGRDPKAINAAHRRIHVQVAPSRWTDNLPNAVLEGVERCTPIVAPNYGSFTEMVESGVNGWLYAQEDGLKNILLQILSDPVSYLHLPFSNATTRLPIQEAESIKNIYDLVAKK